MAQEKQIKTRVALKHDIEENWITAGDNGFCPLAGEVIIYDIDEKCSYLRYKIGRWVNDDKTVLTNINDLPFEANIQYIEQTLTDAQKAQVRANIGAIGMQYNEISQDGEILIYDATTNNLVNSGYTFASLKEWIQQEIQQTILGGEW